MDFVANQTPQIEEMLKEIEVPNIEELFSAIPKHLRLDPPVAGDGLSEYEGMKLMEEIAAQNTYSTFDNYLGAGSYEHHIPALVQSICSRGEFLTSYTPYQPEASQGTLQSIFEFQSCICALTGMDASNASLYDGATACAEAALMALRHHKERKKILISETVHPHYKAVVEQYLISHDVEIQWIPFLNDGSIDINHYRNHIDGNTAAVLFQFPNFFGGVEDLRPLTTLAKSHEALTIISANPLVYGLFASASELGADIAVGDAQPFGLPMQFGGPYVGYIACKQQLLRQLPGRIVGETKDTKGRRGFVLTLQAREQHIRREKATSNICTNQALAALASLIAMAWYGKKGIQKLALTNFQRAAYLRSELEKIEGITPFGPGPYFNEFVVKFEAELPKVIEHFRSRGIEPGLDLGRYFPQLKNCLLIAVTETKSRRQLDAYIATAKEGRSHA